MNNDNSIINIEYNTNDITSRVNVFVKEHNIEEILEAISECEICLTNNEVIISSLNERGFKHLINILLGRDRRNNVKYRLNVQTIQRLLIKLNRTFLQRLIDDEINFHKYIHEENQRDLIVLKQLNQIKKQHRDTRYRVKISDWMQIFAYKRNAEGILYRDLSAEEQTFLIMADYCNLCNYDDQNDLETRIYTVLGHLDLMDKSVDIFEFYKVALNNRDRLYLNDFKKYSKRINIKYLSELGECLYDYSSFESQANFYYSQNTNDKISDEIIYEYLKFKKKKIEKYTFNNRIDIKELLCEYVIDDVLFIKNEIKRIEAEDALADEVKRKIEDAKKRKKHEELLALLEYRKNAFIIKINPEGIYKIGPSCHETLMLTDNKNNKNHSMTFELKEFIRANISSWNAKFIIIENIDSGVFKTINPNLDFISKICNLPIVSMSDYYMTLYATYMKDIDLQYNNVLFAEYDYKKLHFYGYSTKASTGNMEFNNIFRNYTFNKNQFPGTIYKEISPKIKLDNFIIYRTFTFPDKPIKTLNDNRLKAQYIDQRLEKKLIESPDTFWNVLDKLNKYVIHYD